MVQYIYAHKCFALQTSIVFLMAIRCFLPLPIALSYLVSSLAFFQKHPILEHGPSDVMPERTHGIVIIA